MQNEIILNTQSSVAKLNGKPGYLSSAHDPVETARTAAEALLSFTDEDSDIDDLEEKTVNQASNAKTSRHQQQRRSAKPSHKGTGNSSSLRSSESKARKTGMSDRTSGAAGSSYRTGQASRSGKAAGGLKTAGTAGSSTTGAAATKASSSKGFSAIGAKPILIVLAVLATLVLLVVLLTMGLSSSTTLTASPEELTEVYEYITRLDAELTQNLRMIPPEDTEDRIHQFVLNGVEIEDSDLVIQTNADLLLSLLVCQIDGLELDIIRPLLDSIHQRLYRINLITEDIEPGEDEAQEPTEGAEPEPIACLYIHVTAYSLPEIMELSPEELERFTAISSAGIYTAQQILSRPCAGNYYISNRWGWRYSGSINRHTGADLTMPIGTDLLAVTQGTVTDLSSDSITICTETRKVVYKHINVAANISLGTEVQNGTVIGTLQKHSGVGCTPDALHLEIYLRDLETNPAFYLPGTGYGSGDGKIAAVALSQLGNYGGQPYWSWYGFSSHVNWCACFVSWCADQCGYIEAGIFPKTAYCPAAVYYFQQRGLWQPGGGQYIPVEGDIIFFDGNHNGEADHIGIVLSCDGKQVTTIEGNYSNRVQQKQYYLSDSDILGYATPNYQEVDLLKNQEIKK